MTTTTTTTFRVRAIAGIELDRVRTSGRDASGHPVERQTAEGGEQLRCCLRLAEPDEPILLFGYRPPMPASPYRETGAVYTHAEPCPGPGGDGYPAAFRGRQQVLRAYDNRGWIRTARVHDGGDPETVIADLFSDPAIVQLHSRNVAWGCYTFTVERAG
ncbi:DUF1203 domain-containing protein [Plantactinospora sp. B24E8]|uniref:DUF1203 domain-containing protein n=1 Tax=Plantactinospora sp. B24E8 TaxID=3153567 RepID=UPI00325EE5AA